MTTTIPTIPETAPFTAEQRQWLNGFLAGLFSTGAAVETQAGSGRNAAPVKTLLVLYGSQTGTAEGLAKKTAKEAAKCGFAAKLLCMEQHESVDLASAGNVLVITSTYGDGDPPDNAQAFWSYLSGENAPRLGAVHFAVLALGDTNYQAFCEFGKKCDARFEALGGRRIHARVDCDLDYEEPARAWTEAVLAALAALPEDSTRVSLAATSNAESIARNASPELESGYSRKRPFPARLLANRLLNAPGSAKEVRHYEISLEGSGLEYEVGDALGVMPSNCPALVADLLTALGCDGEEAVPLPEGGETSLRLALAQHYDITKPSSELLKAVAEHSGDGEFQALLLDSSRRDDLKKWLWGREIIDVLAKATLPFAPVDFVVLLKKLQPRLYSISSSPKAHPGEVHLTVAAVRYEAHGRSRKGVCSTFLADRAGENGKAPVFVQTSHGFRLPGDGTVPLIMVGPGTGIAPFRAFLEERQASGAQGRNWLFFGDQKRETDYLYREELEAMSTGGHLSRLDLAFSRDQAEKIYVQTRMLEAAAELWAWLEQGAHFYVCGDAGRMAKDVDAALHQVAETAGRLSKEKAAEYIAAMRTAKRYQRDVY